jgi:predicted glycosyltransferase
LLAEKGLILQIPERELTAARLTEYISQAMQAPAPGEAGIDMDGAKKSARLIAAELTA